MDGVIQNHMLWCYNVSITKQYCVGDDDNGDLHHHHHNDDNHDHLPHNDEGIRWRRVRTGAT